MLDDVSNNENEYFEANESNIHGKKNYVDNEVDDNPERGYEDLLDNDFGKK